MPRESLVATDVRKQYFRASRTSARTFDAVAPTTLTLAPGELVVCMGRSGSGKSTLLNMLCGLTAPTEGTVALGDRELYGLSDEALSRLRNERFGVVPQGQTTLHTLTVLENVTLPHGLYGAADSVEPRAIELLARMGIEELAESFPRELSGGELRRVTIARALVGEPDLVFADEPTSDLDDETTALILGLLREVADVGRTVFVVTHEAEASRVADRVLRMDAGVLSD